jgi:hypothetical protein
MRVKQDVIPGVRTFASFTPTLTGDFEVACSQLCGQGHYRMRAVITVESEEAFPEIPGGRGRPAMSSLLRGLRGQRSLMLAAIASLAIGIGANTAIFSVVNALLLRPLDYRDADRLTILWNRSPGLNIQEDWFSTAQYFDIKRRHSGFDDVAIAIGANYNLTGSGEPERIGVMRVSSNLLPMLGAQPEAGQLFVPEDDAPGRTATAVLGHAFWVRRFGGDRSVIGQPIVLNGQTFQIIGVLPDRFRLPREVLPTLGLARTAKCFSHCRCRRRRRTRARARTTTSSRDSSPASPSNRHRRRWTRSRPACAATFPTSTRRMAASRSPSCRCSTR